MTISRDAIEALLPQTQCGRCDHSGCRPYAEALLRGEDTVNKCTPGGQVTMEALAQLLDTPPLPLNSERQAQSMAPFETAFIQETACIGCTLCIRACPTDAIVGASGVMHTVLTSDCTGCEKCVPACPVQCIDMVSVEPREPTWTVGEPERAEKAQYYQTLTLAKHSREANQKAKKEAQRLQKKRQRQLSTDIQAALSRYKKRRNSVDADHEASGS